MALEKKWFILRVQSEREKVISDHLESRIRAAGLERYFGRIVVPTEHVTDVRGGKKRVIEQKMYPGYILAQVAVDENGKIPDEAWFLVVETPGISGFVSSDQKKPLPLPDEEAQRILSEMEEKKEKPRPKVEFHVGESVKIREGPFENFDGTVEDVDLAKGRVKVSVSIFGRSTSVEVEFGSVEKI